MGAQGDIGGRESHGVGHGGIVDMLGKGVMEGARGPETDKLAS